MMSWCVCVKGRVAGVRAHAQPRVGSVVQCSLAQLPTPPQDVNARPCVRQGYCQIGLDVLHASGRVAAAVRHVCEGVLKAMRLLARMLLANANHRGWPPDTARWIAELKSYLTVPGSTCLNNVQVH